MPLNRILNLKFRMKNHVELLEYARAAFLSLLRGER